MLPNNILKGFVGCSCTCFSGDSLNTCTTFLFSPFKELASPCFSSHALREDRCSLRLPHGAVCTHYSLCLWPVWQVYEQHIQSGLWEQQQETESSDVHSSLPLLKGLGGQPRHLAGEIQNKSAPSSSMESHSKVPWAVVECSEILLHDKHFAQNKI